MYDRANHQRYFLGHLSIGASLLSTCRRVGDSHYKSNTMASTQEVKLDAQIHTSNPWLSRHFPSSLLQDKSTDSSYINTLPKETYGNPSHPISFRLGNGGAGYTGLLQLLSETYIKETHQNIRIAWIPNHSRHSQIALLSGVVHIALTYDSEDEEVSIHEGWAERVGGRVFNDHFVLAGPVGVEEIHEVDGIGDALRMIVEDRRIRFHSRGDGSATFIKEQKLWAKAGVDVKGVGWIETVPMVPYDALVKAGKEGAFLLSDRSTYLTAKRDGVVEDLRVHVEGGRELLNSCSAMVGSGMLVEKMEGGGESHVAAREFAEWLGGERAQEIVGRYGRDWELGKPLFTVAKKEEFDERDWLVRRC